MDPLEAFKASLDRTHLEILKGLKDPAKNFPPQNEGGVNTAGVYVSSIQEGIGLPQPTMSDYLAILQRADLAEARRIGRRTCYERNEANICALIKPIGTELQLFLRHNISKIPDIPFYQNGGMQ